MPRKRKAPDILGGYDAYRIGVSGNATNGALGGYPVDAEHLTREERLNILTRISTHLPEWAYLYVAPGENLTPFPIVLHQGVPLLFVRPEQ